MVSKDIEASTVNCKIEGEIDFSYNGRKFNGIFKTEGSTDSIASGNTVYNISFFNGIHIRDHKNKLSLLKGKVSVDYWSDPFFFNGSFLNCLFISAGHTGSSLPQGFSLAAVSRGCPSLRCVGFSSWGPLSWPSGVSGVQASVHAADYWTDLNEKLSTGIFFIIL